MTHMKRIERCEKALTKILQAKPHSKSHLHEQLVLKFSDEDIDETLCKMENDHAIVSFRGISSSSDDRKDLWFQWSIKKN